MAVDSRISSKTYKTNVDELEPNDQNIKSELYEVSIFNHVIKISPGLVIQEDNLSYCYVYAIKNNKVVKKIGVYETLDESPDVFDLSTFREGSLCLFDVYERNPSLILELEEAKSTPETKDTEDVFDYLLTKINDDEPDKKIALTKNSYKGILLVLTTKKKVQEDENSRIITNLLNLIKKSITTKKYFNETTQESIKKYAKELNKKILSLIVSEPFLKIRFIFTQDDMAYDDSEFREWSIKTDITEYVIVSVDTFEVLDTYPADSLIEKYKDMLVVSMPQGTSLNTETKLESKLEPMNEIRGSSLNGPKESKVKSVPFDPAEVDLNAPEPEPPVKSSKPSVEESKPSVKESKTKTTSQKRKVKPPGLEVDLNTIDEAEEYLKSLKPSVEPLEPSVKPSVEPLEAETKTKTRKTRTPKKEESKEPEEPKKIKAPGASIRTKTKLN